MSICDLKCKSKCLKSLYFKVSKLHCKLYPIEKHEKLKDFLYPTYSSFRDIVVIGNYFKILYCLE